MRPLKLELKGFTVYKTPQVIDFSKLNFFVIQGRTGAGKTSIIDAITFALYGKVPRYENRDAKKLVLSRGEKELRVSLEFSVRGKTYRIDRYYRVSPEDTIIRVYEGEKRLNLKGKEVDKWINKISGIDYKTFTKVILLPQGAFDRFLKESSERKTILIELLGLEELEKIRELASETYRNLEGKREALKREWEDLKDITENTKKLLERELKLLKEELENLLKELETLETELRKSEERESLIGELKSIKNEIVELEKKKEEIEQLKEKLELSRKVAPFVPVAKRLQNIEELLRQLKLKHQKLSKDLITLQGEIRLAEEKREEIRNRAEEIEKLRRRREEIVLTLEKLKEVETLLGEIKRLSSEIPSLEENLKNAYKKVKELEERIKKGQEYITSTEKELKEVEENFSEEEYLRLTEKKGLLEELKKLKKKLEERKVESNRVRERLKILEKEHKQIFSKLKKVERELEEKEIHYYAYMLSSLLSEGDVCPVCGGEYRGRQHIRVNVYGIGELKAEKESLERKERELEKEKALYEQRLKALEEELQIIRGEIENVKKEIPPNLLERLEKLKRLREEKIRLEKKLRKFREALQERYEEREKALEVYHEIKQKIEIVKEQLKEKKEKLKEFRKFYGVDNLETFGKSLREELMLIEREIEAFEIKREEIEKYFAELMSKKSKLEGEISSLSENVEQLEKERKENLKTLGKLFGIAKSPEDVLALYLGEEEKKVEESIRVWEERYKLLKGLEEEIRKKLEELSGVKPLSEIKPLYEQKKRQREELIKKAGELEKELKHLEEKLQRKKEIDKEIKDIEDKLYVYGVIRNDFRSDRFIKYMSDIMLRRIVDRASEYMEKFTGNYFFELAKTTGSRDRDIVVVDRASGQIRPVSSLSGGETFLASLSLAFSVSDILSGSANLESLFIDEGFGSLDQEMRERVSEILETIKTNVNKMVGIISHLPDLAERFEQRIVVEKFGDSSQIKVFY